MSYWRSPPAQRHDDVRISAIRVAFAVSLLVHAALLWTYLPKMRILTPTDATQGDAGTPLAVQLAPLQSPPGSMPSTPPPPEPLVTLQANPRNPSPPKAAARRSTK